MVSEHDIQNAIRLELSKRGIQCFRINVGKVRMSDGRWFNTGAPKGFSDLFGFRPDGQIFFIEVKNEKGRVRPEQTKFMEIMKQRGALVGVARSVEDALGIVNERTNH
ncbi:VRR-NUC domain-containing protein [Streptococcus hyovaginalis]